MNRTKLKNYAPQARREFIQAMTDRAAFFGLTAKKIEPVVERGDVALIAGREHPRAVARKRKQLEDRIQRQGFEPTMEALAYTWFNRLVAIRFMELHGYLDHGYRVLSPVPGEPGASATGRTPEILEHAEHVELPGLKRETVIDLKLAGNKEGELYRLLLTAQCNALHTAMPFLFEKIDDETELLLPDNLLHSDSLIRKLVGEIDEEDWNEVEIIGWLYQFYISEKKDEVIGKVVASADIPAATQLFTPNWIVKYLVQNTLGRQWLATYPQSALRQQMQYYIEPAEQTPEVQEQLKAITPTSLNPEELTLLDPACGSGHILVEAYDLFKAIYQERGYRAKDIPALILQKNLFGLEIDDRAAQLAAFALMMKARADDRHLFQASRERERPDSLRPNINNDSIQPNIVAFQPSTGMNAEEIYHALTSPLKGEQATDPEPPPPKGRLFEPDDNLFTRAAINKAKVAANHPLPSARFSQADIATLLELFENAKTFGSLIQIPPNLAAKLPEIEKRVDDVLKFGDLTHASAHVLEPLLQQARLLTQQYNAVVANPPYMGSSNGMSPNLKRFVDSNYAASKQNLCTVFIEQSICLLRPQGQMAMVTLQGWMFSERYTDFRRKLLTEGAMLTMAHLGPYAFPEISGEVVQTTVFSYTSDSSIGTYTPVFYPLYQGDSESKRRKLTTHTERIQDIRWNDFFEMPGHAILYWASKRIRELFVNADRLDSIMQTREGMTTADNDRFIRWFWEVRADDIMQNCESTAVGAASALKWFPYVKGGEFRRWYGNTGMVVNWQYDGAEIRSIINPGTMKVRSHNYNGEFAYKSGLSWTSISTKAMAARSVSVGCMFDTKGPMAFFANHEDEALALGIINSKLGYEFMRLIAPSLDFKLGHVGGIPFVTSIDLDARIASNVRECVSISQADWDSLETSSNFSVFPMCGPGCQTSSISESFEKWVCHCSDLRCKLISLEQENNHLLLDLYGVLAELSPEVSDDQITLYRPEREEDIQRLISYAIGCMMGRYSLDKPGLVYAHSGNQGFDPSQYKSFRADDDGIIPLLETDWGIRDDATNRIEEFVNVCWPGNSTTNPTELASVACGPLHNADDPLHDSDDVVQKPKSTEASSVGGLSYRATSLLDENLKFIADSLGPNNGEQPRETIRRYLATGFYKHHLSMYKKRPIYWLWVSGKQRAFQCLVYLHRYHEGTLARMRTEYVIPLQGQIAARIEHLEEDKARVTSTSHRNKLQKEQNDLKKQQAELLTFEEKLKHAADQKISLDLDDGVKVNYAKFGDLLADVKAVCGTKDDE